MKYRYQEFEETLNGMYPINVQTVFGTDVNNHEYSLLHIIEATVEKSGEERVCVSELVNALPVTAQAISKCLRNLENKGCISRYADPADRRRTIVTITDSGKVVHNRITQGLRKFMEYVFDGLEETEYYEYLRLTKKLKKLYSDSVMKLTSDISEKDMEGK